MIDQLTTLLPLHQFPGETISTGTEFHHFGTLDASAGKLDRPLWVSDRYDCALPYKNFGLLPAPRYTKLVTADAFKIVDLNGIGLQQISAQLNIYDHCEWNKHLAAYLAKCSVCGIVYAGREIFLPDPSQVIRSMESFPC
jgi:hypothetical protein